MDRVARHKKMGRAFSLVGSAPQTKSNLQVDGIWNWGAELSCTDTDTDTDTDTGIRQFLKN